MPVQRGRGTTHWASPTTTRTLLILVFGRAIQAQTTLGRWGQSSLLLSPSSNPYLIVTSGKTYVPGQTLLSTPSTSSSSAFLSLDLSQTIQDLSNPPWTTIGGEGGEDAPIASYGNLVALNRSTGFWFGGDATGDPRVPVQTRSDSSYLLSLSLSQSNLEGSWEIPQSGGWVNQPERREMAFMNSATNGTITRSWIYGGLRSDGSGIGFNEMWEMRMDLSDGSVEWAQLPATGMTAGPKGANYDGSSVLIPSSQQGGDPTLYFLGGVDSSSNSLVSFDTIYSFTPSDALASGTWSTLTTASTAIPSPRRGHSAIYLESESQIYISGGRDLTGTQVFTDNWIFDLQAKSWNRMSDSSEASWGSSTVLLGETILMSFGYGLNSPASTSLKVYAFKNDTWLNSYYPSYQLATTLPTNPKASGSSSSTSSETPSTSAGNPTNPKAHQQPESSSSSSSSSSENTSSSSSSGSSSSANNGDSSSNPWTSPGQPNSPSNSDSTSDSSSKPNSDDSGGPSKSLLAGAVVGSLLGALVVAVLGVYGTRQRKRKRSLDGADRYTGGSGGFGRKFRYGDEDEEFVGMVEKEKFAGGGGGGGLTGLFALPTSKSSPRIGGGGGLAILGGGNKRRRFDMLQDEEEDAGEAQTSRRGWTRFDDVDELDESSGRERVPSDMSDGSARIGVGIWGGMGGGGLGRSESVKSGTSYLGTNLGGFLRSSESSSASHEYGGLAGAEQGGGGGDASLTPIAEWEEDEDEDDEDGTLESGYAAGVGDYSSGGGGTKSTETHQTRSTFTHVSSFNSHEQHEEASIRTATRVIRPFSPSCSSSLYGSGFHTPLPFNGHIGGIERSTSTSSSLFLSPIRRDNSSSWWSRLKHQHQYPSEIPTATAFEAIRDPTPAPKNLEEQEQLSILESNPFSDPTPSSNSSLERSGSLNEHGLMSSRAARGIHDRSISSNVSEVTATSSVLEERMRGMDVVQRIRTGEGSDGSASIGANSNQNTPELSQDPFSDPSPPSAISQTPGSVIFAGSQAAFSPRQPESPVPSIPPFPLLPVILPPTPTRTAQTPPQSPRKTRLMGPRPQPSQQLPTIARSGSVKDLVAEIERRNSLPSTPVGTPIPSPTKATRSRTTGHGSSKTTKVEHGLVKKPKLYVANP
ncbi:hypothetical protein JCM3765_000166 [Sporobolomyces pararoseus]